LFIQQMHEADVHHSLRHLESFRTDQRLDVLFIGDLLLSGVFFECLR
jgi:hypothetical protein